jgi:hypothetical protein
MFVEDTVDAVLRVAASQPDHHKVATAITPLLATLRRSLETTDFQGPARIRTYTPPAVRAGESHAMTADRVGHRLNDLHCARVLGTPEDVRAVIEMTVNEVRTAAMGQHRVTT